jgi:hypothetical protein
MRLFLEGVEVPVISAQIQVAANTPASASIQVIATDKVLDLLPRTVVHLFFYDYVESGNPALERDPADKVYDAFGDEVLNYDDQDFFNSRYKLLFMGELFSIEFQKTSFNRAIVLQCSDFSNYWDTTFQYNFGGSLFGGRREAAFIGANSNFFTSPLGHGVGAISALLNSRSSNFPKLKGLMAGVVRMLEAIGGSYYGKNTFRGCNDFTSIAELRIKVLQQITAAEKDNSTAKLFARKAFNMWMNRQSGSLGKLVSFRGLVKLMFDFIFHEVYPCPSAMYVPSTTKEETRETSSPLSSTSTYKGLMGQIKSSYDKVNWAYSQLKTWHGYVGETQDVQYDAMNRYLAAYAGAMASVVSVYTLGMTAPKSSSLGIVKDLTTIHVNMGVIGVLQGSSRIFKIPGRRLDKHSKKEFAPSTRGYKNDTSFFDYTQVVNRYEECISAFKRLLGLRMSGSTKITIPMPARVNNQIFRPDIFYAPPPRCNVLFPESYDQFSFARQYMREVSRIELQTHNELLGKDALFNSRYYAPDIRDVRDGVKLSSMRFAKLIMDHELYTGIIPMFENMSEANIFSMASGKSVKEGEKVGFAQRAVNHQYFKYRFQARAMDASGRFNPYFVPGFPALIIDKPMDIGRLSISSMPLDEQFKALSLKVDPKEKITRSQILQQLVSPQYMGVCASLIHSVTQDGGRTQYQFMHARVHRESTEFLGVDKVTVSRVMGAGTRTVVVAAPKDHPPTKKSRGRYGIITDVLDVSVTYKGRLVPAIRSGLKVIVGNRVPASMFKKPTDSMLPDQEFKIAPDTFAEGFGTDETKGTEPWRGGIGTDETPSKWKGGIGTDETANVKAGHYVLVGAFELREKILRRFKEKVDLPIEEAIKAPWIWPGWCNPQINETYMQFFGTTGITDIAGVNAADENAFFLDADDVDVVMQEEMLVAQGVGTKKKKSGPLPRDVRAQEMKAAKQYQKTVLLGDTERTVENSVDFLVRAYSFVKIANADVGDFLRSYGWRPIATMVDILGSADLEIKKVTKKVAKTKKQRVLKRKAGRTLIGTAGGFDVVNKDMSGGVIGKEHVGGIPIYERYGAIYGTRYVNCLVDQTGYEVSGKEGFHSRAFGDVEDLFGLVSPTVQTVLKLDKMGKRKVAERMDVRKRRREVVRNYVEELTGSRGLLG